ncbi:hypothetical protein N7468_009384 [Penicillium chermesinum]|uniref:Uncharacterized protein n=1 Tax=Penicillium chermesinum TaxID=63820 RepID=A0A9W9NHQ3_9EURO|nr:uncharacterized protein N7468_009384 [Penicillium chermesinum]KAJ5220180.1 hypothetical protein N7468_009384 [Penicillium chermesinum]
MQSHESEKPSEQPAPSSWFLRRGKKVFQISDLTTESTPGHEVTDPEDTSLLRSSGIFPSRSPLLPWHASCMSKRSGATPPDAPTTPAGRAPSHTGIRNFQVTVLPRCAASPSDWREPASDLHTAYCSPPRRPAGFHRRRQPVM